MYGRRTSAMLVIACCATVANEMGERAADLAGTDQSNLGTRHREKNLG